MRFLLRLPGRTVAAFMTQPEQGVRFANTRRSCAWLNEVTETTWAWEQANLC
ncbi:MAG TPA: hypothetical protein VEK14_09190 [Rhodomicrobium sp.]|nr:hypothetical protein [Rhodomicrobium sp.]